MSCNQGGRILRTSSTNSKFVTGAVNGTVSLWKDKKIEKSNQVCNERTLVLFKQSRIFAASKNKVVQLDMNLDILKKFEGRNAEPLKVDANESYLVVVYDGGDIDVHSRKELDQNGTNKKIMVSRFNANLTLILS